MLEQTMNLPGQSLARQAEKAPPATASAKEKAVPGKNSTPLPQRIMEYVRFAVTGHPTTGMQIEDLTAKLDRLTASKQNLDFYANMGGDSRHSSDGFAGQDLDHDIAEVRAQLAKLQKG